MNTFTDFVQYFGPVQLLEEANIRWQECRIPCRDYPNCAPMFTGQFWNSGYFLPGNNPSSSTLPWTKIIQDVKQSSALAERLTGILVHSDTDSAYYPCFFQIPSTLDFNQALKITLGWQVPAEFEESKFWGDMQVRPLLPDNNAFFWDPLDDDVVDEYYNPSELSTLREITAIMKANLTDLRHITFPEAYITYPNFWLGHTPHGSWVGLWALRVDT